VEEVAEGFSPVCVEKGDRLGGGERPEGLSYPYWVLAAVYTDGCT